MSVASPADTTASRAASSFPWFSKWCGRSASKVTASPVAQLVALAVDDAASTAPVSTTAVSRAAGLVHRRVAGAAGRAPGASVWRETSARWPGSGGVRIS